MIGDESIPHSALSTRLNFSRLKVKGLSAEVLLNCAQEWKFLQICLSVREPVGRQHQRDDRE